MFWKKKPKEEKNAAPPPPPLPPPPLPTPPRAEARTEPRPATPTPTPATAPASGQSSGAAAGDRAAQLAAALSRRAGPQAAPMTADSVDALMRALDSLLAEPALQSVARDIAAEQLGPAFDALERDAAAARDAGKWRRVGAILYGVDGPRARNAYEQAFALEPQHFLGGVFVARLRALAQDLAGANEAASTAIMAARTPDERGVAFFEAALIAMGREDFDAALTHGEQAVEASRGAIRAGARDALALRDYVARLTLLGDVQVVRQNFAAAQALYADALTGARKLAEAANGAPAVKKGVAELLEKSASVAASAPDPETAMRFAAEAVSIRRKLLDAGEPGAQAALAAALNSMGEALRLGGNPDAAKFTLREAFHTAQSAVAVNPGDATARRDVWLALWRLASLGNAGVSWKQVAEAMEAAAAAGALNPKHQHFFDEARRRAAA